MTLRDKVKLVLRTVPSQVTAPLLQLYRDVQRCTEGFYVPNGFQVDPERISIAVRCIWAGCMVLGACLLFSDVQCVSENLR